MASKADELVLRVSATEELLKQQLREMGRSVETFEQAAEGRIAQLERRWSGVNLSGAIDAVRDVDKAFKDSYRTIESYAEQISRAMSQGGNADISSLIAQSKQRADMLMMEAEAARVLVAAEEQRLSTLPRVSQQEQAAIAAGRAFVAKSQASANAAAQETQRLQQLAQQMGVTAATQRQMVASSGAMRSGLQQAGFQVQDFAVQIAGGTSAIRALSLQAPQLFGALQLMASGADNAGGKFAAFARFLSGGWGVAIGIAIPLIGMLAERMLTIGDSADKSTAQVDRLRSSMQALLQLQGRMDYEKLGNAQVGAQRQASTVQRLDKQILAAEKRFNDLIASSASPEATAGAAAVMQRDINALKEQRRIASEELDAMKVDIDTYGKQVAARKRLDALAAKPVATTTPTARGGGSATASRARIDEAKAVVAEYDELLADNMQLINKFNSGMSGIVGGDEIGAANDNIADQMLKAQEALKQAARDNEEATKRIQVAWTDTAQSVIANLQSMSGAVKSGDFLSIMSAALGLFTQLGSIGVFGKSIQNNLRVPGRAVGGPVSSGMPYVVGERGPELFVPATAGKIIPNNSLRSPSTGSIAGTGRPQQVVVQVVANDYFDARVEQRAVAVAAPIGMRAAAAGSSDAQSSIVRSRRNRIPGR